MTFIDMHAAGVAVTAVSVDDWVGEVHVEVAVAADAPVQGRSTLQML